MRPAWDGIVGWFLIGLALTLLVTAAAGPGLDGRHVLATILFGVGMANVAYRSGQNARGKP